MGFPITTELYEENLAAVLMYLEKGRGHDVVDVKLGEAIVAQLGRRDHLESGVKAEGKGGC